MNFGLKGKFALVTGGSHGIGRAIALALAEEGCNVAVMARNRDRLDETVKELLDKGVGAYGIEADALLPESASTVFQQVRQWWHTIHILVNNVGGGGRWGSAIVEDTSERVWQEVYEKNTGAARKFTMKAVPLMHQQGWGRVVTIASIYGREAGGSPWFAMAKNAQIALMKSLSQDSRLVRAGITFNTVCPGAIMIPDTGWDEMRKTEPEAYQLYAENLPMGRLGTPEEVAPAVVFLCSEQAKFINGACLVLDGGQGRSL